MDPSERASATSSVPSAGAAGRGAARGPADPDSVSGGAAGAVKATPSGEPARGGAAPDRIEIALDAINALAICVDQTIREMRRGTAAQWRFVQDELTRVRRLVATSRPAPVEGPPRDEGFASQPPPEGPPRDGGPGQT